jgi:hypothetical protein
VAGLAFEHFAAAVGRRFEMETGAGAWPVELVMCSPLADSGREGGSFRLEFRGPADPIVPQGTYLFRGEGEAHEIFVSPIARSEAGTRYEAIFY